MMGTARYSDENIVSPSSRSALTEGSLIAAAIPEEESVMSQGFQGDRIQVAVRLRPLYTPSATDEFRSSSRNSAACIGNSLLLQTNAKDRTPAWVIQDGDTIVQKGAARKTRNRNLFTLDYIFGEATETTKIYQEIGRPIVRSVLSGQHGTIFAYGQTGSGKTFTMIGGERVRDPYCELGECDGLVQMAMRELFEDIEGSSDKREYEVMVQYFEIYNEEVRDLIGVVAPERPPQSPSPKRRIRSSTALGNGSPLRTDTRSRSSTPFRPDLNRNILSLRTLKVLEDKNGNVFVNAKANPVASAGECISLLKTGNRNRACAATNANEHSSRSHAVFRVSLESRPREVASTGQQTTRVSVLNLVDLAGSENGNLSGNNATRKREGGQINKSLLSLSRVIYALSLPETERPSHIGFRDSKLTRILQPSLSGNAAMAILCCASLAKSDLEETRSTLKFASSAKQIAVKPVVNEIVDNKDAVLRLQQEILILKRSLQLFKDQHASLSNRTTATVSSGGSSLQQQPESEPASPRRQVSPRPILTLRRRSSSSRKSASSCYSVEELLEGESPTSCSTSETTATLSPRTLLVLGGRFDDNSSSDGNRSLPPVAEVKIESLMSPGDQNITAEDRLDEQRASYLEERIEATETMLERIFSEQQISRRFLMEAGAQNREMQLQMAQFQRETKEAADEQVQILSGWYFLFCIVLYVFGLKEFFISAIVLLWLSLQVARR